VSALEHVSHPRGVAPLLRRTHFVCGEHGESATAHAELGRSDVALDGVHRHRRFRGDLVGREQRWEQLEHRMPCSLGFAFSRYWPACGPTSVPNASEVPELPCWRLPHGYAARRTAGGNGTSLMLSAVTRLRREAA
jgi:hypothetical protein